MSAVDAGGVTIRRLGAGDAEVYRTFRLEALRETPEAFTSSYEEERAKPVAASVRRLAEGVLLGAFAAGGGLIGTAGLRLRARSQERHKATLFGMAVARAAGGRGVGRALVEQALELAAAEAELRQVLLTVSEGNEAAVRLYTSCGFEVWGREPRAVLVGGRAVTKLHMVRFLGSCQSRSAISSSTSASASP
ncbi:GNAT family N-acetyltransferase [Streptomyces sp. SP17BM10]|uniref:GNAT family N-acetyltransferase n=1 Tax=Streptomyces sp. SP17BM10 TaxID=3002530 RepID=UPI002E7698E0|nr:GNAT family N-acetyltransferase [Streptomyces sp. SP17BM10]MEE1782876.1 GNAT family N-acetyltransferase [Streptomyces sp. SP17BM10]